MQLEITSIIQPTFIYLYIFCHFSIRCIYILFIFSFQAWIFVWIFVLYFLTYLLYFGSFCPVFPRRFVLHFCIIKKKIAVGGLYLEEKSGKIFFFFLNLGKIVIKVQKPCKSLTKNGKKIIVTMKKKHFGAVSDFICIYMELHLLY